MQSSMQTGNYSVGYWEKPNGNDEGRRSKNRIKIKQRNGTKTEDFIGPFGPGHLPLLLNFRCASCCLSMEKRENKINEKK